MSRDLGRLVVASLLSVGTAATIWLMFSGRAAPVETASGPALPGRNAPASTKGLAKRESVPTRLYAVAVDEHGLPPSAGRGSQLELWVTWDRPHPERTRLEKLLPSATLNAVTPAFTPGGPAAAMLRVEVSQIPELVHAERHGTLKVRLPSARPVE